MRYLFENPCKFTISVQSLQPCEVLNTDVLMLQVKLRLKVVKWSALYHKESKWQSGI